MNDFVLFVFFFFVAQTLIIHLQNNEICFTFIFIIIIKPPHLFSYTFNTHVHLLNQLKLVSNITLIKKKTSSIYIFFSFLNI